MRQEPGFLGEDGGVLVYIARKLREAKALEELLTSRSIDYVVEADEYSGGFLFQTVRVGAFFYVRPEVAALTRQTLLDGGYKPYAPVAQAPDGGS